MRRANRNGISPIAISPLFYDNIIETLLKENPSYESWISAKKTYYTTEYYHCNIVETGFNDWIDGGMN